MAQTNVSSIIIYPNLKKHSIISFTETLLTWIDFTYIIQHTAIVEQASDDFDMVLRNACRAALKKGLVSYYLLVCCD